MKDVPRVRTVLHISNLLKCIPQGKAVGLSSAISKATKTPEMGGSKPKAYWEAAINHVWEMLYSGGLVASNQADIENALKDFVVSKGHNEPSTSSTRVRAKMIWANLKQD